MRTLRLGYLSGTYPQATDTFVRTEIRHLRALGHDVRTFSSHIPEDELLITDEVRRERAQTKYLLADGGLRLCRYTLLTAIRFPSRFLAAVRLAWALRSSGCREHLKRIVWLAEAAHLARSLRRCRVDHLHAHDSGAPTAVAVLASVLSGCPYSFTVHGPPELDMAGALRLAVKVKHAAFVVAVSNWTRGELLRWSDPEDWPRIRIVRCGVSPQFLQRADSPVGRDSRLVVVGNLVPRKGHLVLIDAVSALTSSGVALELVVIGDGPMRPEIEKSVARLGLQRSVTLRGRVDEDDLRDAIRSSRALVMPSFAEGLPVAVMEALALGRPVIATHVGGIPDLVQTDVCGWLVPPGSVEALANAIRYVLLAPPSTLTRLGAAGAVRVRRDHNGAVEAAKLAQLFRSQDSAMHQSASHP
jgi:colanic acid/amylovoran biosynthesis glycosyltransferase